MSKLIGADGKYKIWRPLPLKNAVFSDEPVYSSCIYKSKYDAATYREKAPHLSYGEKVDLIKKCVCA